MKRIVTLLLAIGSSLASLAQYHPLINTNNTWKGVTYGWGTFTFWEHVEGDSLINIVPYKKVWTSQTLSGDQYNIGLLREDVESRKVYVWTGETEHLLYDFAAEQGDVVTSWGVGMEQVLTITSTEVVQVNGTDRKKINFQDAWAPAYWIEGIGSVYGLMDGALGQIVDYSPNLTCFYEGTVLAWDNPESTVQCEALLAVDETDRLQLSVWPNPANDVLNMYVGNGASGIYQLRIVSSLGEIVYAQQINLNGIQQIRLPELSSGFYILSLHLKDAQVTSVRILKE